MAAAVDGGGFVQSARSVEVQAQRPSQIGSVTQLLSGGIAGAVSKTCTAPLARLTILFQVRGMRADHALLGRPSMLRETERIFREEGFKAFWKGNGVTVVHRLPYSAISFSSYEKYKTTLLRALGAKNEQETFGVQAASKLLAGGAAGVTAASITYPLDLVRTRLATQTTAKYYRGIVHALATISRQEGFNGLYKGLGPTLLCVGPNVAMSFFVYETAHSYWVSRRPDSPNFVTSLVCGGLSGICASTVTFPIDLVKRRMQLEGDARWTPAYKPGLSSTLRHVMQTEGYRGLYRGILPEYLKVAPSVGIAFMIYDFMKRLTA